MVFYYFFTDCFEFFFYSFLTFVVSILMLVLCNLMTVKELYTEKMLGYECGFDPFSDARSPFNVKFYIMSMMFMMFDVEVSFFFPWSVCLRDMMFVGFITMYLFMMMLAIGFFYEWKKGALEWD